MASADNKTRTFLCIVVENKNLSGHLAYEEEGKKEQQHSGSRGSALNPSLNNGTKMDNAILGRFPFCFFACHKRILGAVLCHGVRLFSDGPVTGLPRLVRYPLGL